MGGIRKSWRPTSLCGESVLFIGSVAAGAPTIDTVLCRSRPAPAPGSSAAPPMQHRRLMEFPSQNPVDSFPSALPPESPLEALCLSVRTRNALKGVGCSTVDDVLRLDIQAPIRGLGRKAKEELLTKLEDAGLAHPLAGQSSEIRMLERSLEKIEERVDAALGSVAKEIRSARQRLRRLKARATQTL